MPGLAGVVSFQRSAELERVAGRMIESMLHEPTYASGTFTQRSLGIAAGWVVHGKSFSDCLPIWNETKDVCLLFAGENFIELEDLNDLRSRGHAFEAHNAGYIIHLYEEFGTSFLQRLNGTFSGLLIDLRQSKAILFNDRFGLGRIYFHESSGEVYFASEAKALLSVLPRLRQLDDRSFAEFFACGCVLQNRTLFSGVSLLPPGSMWTFHPDGTVRKESYFDKAVWESQPRLAEAEYYEKLKDTFSRVMPRYIRDGESVAMSLTGGLDSRIIMAWTRRAPSTLPCYSHRGMFRECADARLARRVARVCGQSHQVLTVGERFFSDFPSLAMRTVFLTDGNMDVLGAPGLYANGMARKQIAPIRITGNYGGEVLRGMVALKPAKLLNPFFNQDFAAQIQEGRKTLECERREREISFIAFKQVPWHHYSRFALESSQLVVRSPYLDNDLVALAYQAPPDLDVNQRLAARLIADGNPALASFPTDRGPLGRAGLFGKAREMFQEFTFKADYAYDYGMPQWLVKLDSAFAPLHLERMFLGRHKYYHFRYWYRTKLAPYVKEVLLDPRSLERPYFDRNRIRKMVDAHVAGRGNYTMEIHNLLTSELIHRSLIERN